MEVGSCGAGLWLSHLLSKASTVQSPLVGVINWPRHPGLSSLLGWSSTSLNPGWASVSLQAQWARQCHFSASILVTKWRAVSGWVFEWESEKRKEEPVASEGMFRAHGGPFIFKAVKMHLKPRGGIYKVTRQKRSGIHKLRLQECHVWSASTRRALYIWKKEAATRKLELLTMISLLNRDNLPHNCSIFVSVLKHLSH